MRFSSAKFSDVDFADIQGLVRQGHGPLTEARYFLLNLRDAAAARAWLAEAPITTAVRRGVPDTALQVAFTCDGLEKLGVPARILRMREAPATVEMSWSRRLLTLSQWKVSPGHRRGRLKPWMTSSGASAVLR